MVIVGQVGPTTLTRSQENSPTLSGLWNGVPSIVQLVDDVHATVTHM